ncbi:hypothetical protein OH797_38635 (plasmid) [Streptomyces anulatus]|uniref:hypothetical protein n=1 Tax=Streptomyces TaxID=1883 RepID=UPI0006F7A8BF|nr:MULTISPECIES: hypothetical protein [Streptomyces]KQX26803.1 hypothetical protein ASD29_30775 [Streptomyces sp. Root1295]KRA45989.1 hypothetical protein ASD97_37880 [Streptomyces sp. Root63]WSC66809.1 hypothetical protein OHA57_39270 [Streptomyces anulatus]
MTATTQQPRTALAGVDLERVTFEQAKGWRCPLCDAILTADRSLGTFTADTGLLTDPTELWACAHPCR